MRFDVVTTFPEMFRGPFDCSIIGRAREKGAVEIYVRDLRDYTTDKHRITDDYPYGGGVGMVMKVEPLAAAVESIKKDVPSSKVVLMSPRGALFDDRLARSLATEPGLVILCGRYEGVDERVSSLLCDMEISVGDYVLTGGEIAAMALIDAVARLTPGVVGDAESTAKESHADYLLEHPHYTRPAEFRGSAVPEILLSGHHAHIEAWRRRRSVVITAERRPDLIGKAELSEEERRLAEEIISEKK